MTVETPDKVEAPEKFDVPETVHPDVQEILKKAHAIIEQGWCQGGIRRLAPDGTMQHCILGAVALAANLDIFGSIFLLDPPLPPREDTLYVNASSLIYTVLQTNPATWNDDPSRTKEDVLHLLEELYR